MKWYETPIEDLYERALSALARNDEDTYKENLVHAYNLIRQREFQTVSIPDGARYQREIFLYRQVIFRIQREFARRAKARDAADPFPHAVPY